MTTQCAGYPITVERFTPSDWQRLRDARLIALASEPDAFGTALAQDLAWSEAQWRRTLTVNMWLRASAGTDGIVGIVAFFPTDTEPDGAPQLGSMWIEPTRRGTGIGRRLFLEVAAHARREGAHELGLWVVEGNQPAAAAYERFGFRASGARKPAPRDPSVPMQRMLLQL